MDEISRLLNEIIAIVDKLDKLDKLDKPDKLDKLDKLDKRILMPLRALKKLLEEDVQVTTCKEND